MYEHLSGARATATLYKERWTGYVFAGGESILGPAAAALARMSGAEAEYTRHPGWVVPFALSALFKPGPATLDDESAPLPDRRTNEKKALSEIPSIRTNALEGSIGVVAVRPVCPRLADTVDKIVAGVRSDWFEADMKQQWALPIDWDNVSGSFEEL